MATTFVFKCRNCDGRGRLHAPWRACIQCGGTGKLRREVADTEDMQVIGARLARSRGHLCRSILPDHLLDRVMTEWAAIPPKPEPKRRVTLHGASDSRVVQKYADRKRKRRGLPKRHYVGKFEV